MQLSKEKLQRFVNNMPENIDVLELIDQVILMAKIDDANDQAINQYIPRDEVEKEMDFWG